MKKKINKIVTTNGSNRYKVVYENKDQICLESKIDGKMEVFEKKKISLFETDDCLIRGKNKN